MKVYVDTNVLIDFVCQRVDFAASANRLMALGSMGKVQLQISALSYVTAMYVAHKYEYQNVKESLLFIAGFGPTDKFICKLLISKSIRKHQLCQIL